MPFSNLLGISTEGIGGPAEKSFSRDKISLGDLANYVAALAGGYLRDFGPLQGQAASILRGSLSGQAPQALAPLIAGRLAQVEGQIPQARRQAMDTLSGGQLGQALSNIAEQRIGQRASAYQDVLGPVQKAALELGQTAAKTPVDMLNQALLARQIGAQKDAGGKK